MIPGHTKFRPDQVFGTIKSRLARTEIDDVEDVANMISNCTRCHFYKPVVYGKEQGWIWRRWDLFLQARYKVIKNLLQYHHFFFDKDGVKVRASIDIML